MKKDRRPLGKQGFALIVAVVTTALSYLIAEAVGPVPVVIGVLRSPTIVAPPWFLASIAFPFGLLVAEALIDYREKGFNIRGLTIFLVLLFMGLVTCARYLFPLPLSGHGLIVTFFLLHQLQQRRAGRTWKLAVGSAVLLQAGVVKLILWRDPASLLVGVGFGTIAWSVEQLLIIAGSVRRQP